MAKGNNNGRNGQGNRAVGGTYAPVTDDRRNAVGPEQTGEQVPSANPNLYMGGPLGLPYVGAGLMFGNGGTFDNPLAFPGYSQYYAGTFPVYRWILRHPTVQLVAAIGIADILLNSWQYEWCNGAGPQEWMDLATDNFTRLRSCLMRDFFVVGRNFGAAFGEPIWELDYKGRTILKRVKPLLNDVTLATRDDHGNFSGIINKARGTVMPSVELAAPYHAWKYTHNFGNEAGYIYGRSWLESIRDTAWRSWLDAAQQLARLGAKIVGTQIVATTPGGTFPGPIDPTTGRATQVSYIDNAAKNIKAMADGAAGVVVPTFVVPVDSKGDIERAKLMWELATKGVATFTVLDCGSLTPAIEGLLLRMRHDEELMFEGGLMPARAGLEARHGAKADAETHSDTGTKISQVNDQDFAEQIQPLLDALLVLNFGDIARGRIRIVPPSLVNIPGEYFKKVLLACLNDPYFVQEFAGAVDIDALLKYLNFKQKDLQSGFNADKMQQAKLADTKKAPGTSDPQGGAPKKD